MMSATIRWFDGMSGEGYVRLADTQTSHYIHFTAIKGIENTNHHWPVIGDQQVLKNIDGMSCLVELSEGRVIKCIITDISFPELIIKLS